MSVCLVGEFCFTLLEEVRAFYFKDACKINNKFIHDFVTNLNRTKWTWYNLYRARHWFRNSTDSEQIDNMFCSFGWTEQILLMILIVCVHQIEWLSNEKWHAFAVNWNGKKNVWQRIWLNFRRVMHIGVILDALLPRRCNYNHPKHRRCAYVSTIYGCSVFT